MSNRPNVLFIVSDQHNAKCTGYAGHPNVKTPHLDRMAAEGVRCDNAITQNPICTPSRVSFLSGQYCHNHGYYGLGGPRPELPSLLSHFRHFGYLTGAVGKIHCPEYWIEDAADVFHETCACSINGRSPQYSAFLQERGKLHLEDHIGLTEFGARGRQSMDGRPSDLTYEESQEGWIAATCSATMRQAVAHGQPFFLHASLPRPHQCTAPSEPFWQMYEGVELELPPNADYEMVHKAPNVANCARHWREHEWALFEPKDFVSARQRKLRGYFGAISQVDHAVGQMLETIRELGIGENTIVVYTADHGDYATEHGIMEKAPGISHDAITRVPMIWWAPGRLQPGHVAAELVELVDISTTLCGLTGVDELETSDGQDLAHLLRGGSGEVHRIAVTEFAWSRSVRKGPWRYVWYAREYFAEAYPEGFGELYNLEYDPWEMTNLYFDPAHAAIVQELRGELLDWLITTTHPTTVHTVSSTNQPTPANWQRYNRFVHELNLDGTVNPKRIRAQLPRTGNYL